MLIAHETLVHLPPELDQVPDLWVTASGQVTLVLNTSDFEVEYAGGKASIRLSRSLTHQQARDLASAILAHVELLEKREKDWKLSTVVSVPLPDVDSDGKPFASQR